MSPDPMGAAAPRRPGRLAVALGLSLLLNLLLVGVVAGRVVGSFDPLRQLAARSPTFLMRFDALPADERARFEAVYRPHRRAIGEVRQNLRVARLTAFGALGAPVYDRAVMAQRLGDVVRATEAAQTAVDAALLDAFAVLSPQSRGVLAGADRPQGP